MRYATSTASTTCIDTVLCTRKRPAAHVGEAPAAPTTYEQLLHPLRTRNPGLEYFTCKVSCVARVQRKK